ncbi:MAG: hypothetical protein IJR93_01620 [Treponema sp.]|nr:hypothetical protein [Treponema sp.]MBQ7165631.1 hypothetical protein [Treponema sp.]
MSFLSRLRNNGMTIYALVGKSGTGKSFRAKLIAEQYALTAIIDDGLLIQDEKIVAGKSAKHEKTYMGAVRVALFDDKEHRDAVAKAIQKQNVKKILIIGTSEKMVQKICDRLQIPQPEKIINIEQIASQEEIQKAIVSRNSEGKHVIPVPAIEVKKSYPQIFYSSVRDFLSNELGKSMKKLKKDKMDEKSIVTPEFSKKGRLEISQAALVEMTLHCIDQFDQDHDIKIHVRKLVIKPEKQGYRLVLTIDVPFGKQLTGTIRQLQEYIIGNIEKNTGIMLEEVSIIIDKITTD